MAPQQSLPAVDVLELPEREEIEPADDPVAPMVAIRQLEKRYRSRDGEVYAVKGVSLDVARGEFVTLLGPSGCGKTTILRSVAGLETPDAGEIVIGGRTVFSSDQRVKLTPAQRKIGMVFQSYAIWPHMTVFDNVAYPLRRRKVSRPEIQRRTTETLEMLGLGHLADRPATNLSGGQQQRVAVARALVAQAELILFDEPLSNLDAKLRKEVRQEIRDIQQRLGITVLYVTHDQEEAMAVSDRILVLDGGIVKDAGSPERIYSRPADVFSARFVGESNVIEGTIISADDDHWLVNTPLGDLHVQRQPGDTTTLTDAVVLTVRPEHMGLASMQDPAMRDLTLPGAVRASSFLGPFAELAVELSSGHEVVVRINGAALHRPGDPVAVRIEPGNVVLHAAEPSA